jgi:hypothetical protein
MDICLPDEVCLIIFNMLPECKDIMNISKVNKRFHTIIEKNIDIIIKKLINFYGKSEKRIIANFLNLCFMENYDKFKLFTKITEYIETMNYQTFNNELGEFKFYLPNDIKSNEQKYLHTCYNYCFYRIHNIKHYIASYYIINNVSNININKIENLVKNGINFKDAYYAIAKNLNDKQINVMNYIIKMCPKFNINDKLDTASSFGNFRFYMVYETFSHIVGNSIIDIIYMITTQTHLDKVIKYYKDGFNINSIAKIINICDEQRIEFMYNLIKDNIDINRAADIISLDDKKFEIVMEFINKHKICNETLFLLFNYENTIIPHVKKIISYGIDFRTAISMASNGEYSYEIIQRVLELMTDGTSCHDAYNTVSNEDDDE